MNGVLDWPYEILGKRNITLPIFKFKSSKLSLTHTQQNKTKEQCFNLPRAREYRAASLLWSTQCAADKTQFWLRREAPHMCRPRYRRDTCQGHELGLASSPPTMREPNGFTPHAVDFKIHCHSIFFSLERFSRNIKCQEVTWMTI